MNDAKFDSYLHALRMSYPDQAELVVAVAKEGYACGVEQMREKTEPILKLVECGYNMLPSNAAGACYELRAAIHCIRNLPVGESSRAPEGTKK